MLALAAAAPAAEAGIAVDMTVEPAEPQFGSTTKVTGTVTEDGAPLGGQAVELQGRRYPFKHDYRPIAATTTPADGTFGFERELDRNFDLRVAVADVVTPRERVYVFPRTKLAFKARNSRVIRLVQRYAVPRGVRLTRPTIFYVGRRGAATAPRAATAAVEKVRPGRYRSVAVVRIPKAWNGRFRYASCFKYTVGSGMGDPRATCPKRFRF